MSEVIDAREMNVRKINSFLKRLPKSTRKVMIKNPDGKHFLAAGLSKDLEIEVLGSTGYFVGTMIHGPQIKVHGNAGWFVGDNMTQGELLIYGDTGNGVAQGINGGTVMIKGDTGERAGSLMKGGTLIIGGDTSIMTGLYMMGGEIIVLGNIGSYAGESIIGGKIFFAGDVKSLGKNASIHEVSEKERRRLQKVLNRYGFNVSSLDFRKIVPERHRPFYKKDGGVNERFRRVHLEYQVVINRFLCRNCRACIGVCPQNVFSYIKDIVVPINESECVGCEICVEYCRDGALRIIPISASTERVWNNYTMNRIRSKASTGHHLVRGTGAWRRFPHFDDIVILCAQTSRPPIDHYREPCNTETVLGERFAERPLKLKAPIMIGAMSFGAISKEAKIAIAKGASRVGIPVNTGEGGMLPEERENASILIAQYASGRFGVSAQYLQAADAIEIKIGQGAKSGQGGLLLGEKVTQEIASIRNIPVGTDAVSPARHLDIVGPEDLKMKIEQLREIVDWKIPIIVKYSAGRVYDDVKIAAKAGADIILVDGKQAGTGAAPEVVLEQAGLPTLPALVEANRALEDVGLRDEVNLVISGGVRDGADIAKAIALGADAVAIATPVLIAMGCRICGLCNTGCCPRGIATQDPRLRSRLKIEKAARKVENFLRATIEELEMLVQLAGKTDVKNLESEDLRALTWDVAAITGIKLAGSESYI